MLWPSPSRALTMWALDGRKLHEFGVQLGEILTREIRVPTKVHLLIAVPHRSDPAALVRASLATTIAHSGYATRHLLAFRRLLQGRVPRVVLQGECQRLVSLTSEGTMLLPFARTSRSKATREMSALSSSLASQDAVIRALLDGAPELSDLTLLLHLRSALLPNRARAGCCSESVLSALAAAREMHLSQSRANDPVATSSTVVVVVGVDRVARTIETLHEVLATWRECGVAGVLVLYRMVPKNYADRRASVLVYDPVLVTLENYRSFEVEMRQLHEAFLDTFSAESVWSGVKLAPGHVIVHDRVWTPRASDVRDCLFAGAGDGRGQAHECSSAIWCQCRCLACRRTMGGISSRSTTIESRVAQLTTTTTSTASTTTASFTTTSSEQAPVPAPTAAPAPTPAPARAPTSSPAPALAWFSPVSPVSSTSASPLQEGSDAERVPPPSTQHEPHQLLVQQQQASAPTSRSSIRDSPFTHEEDRRIIAAVEEICRETGERPSHGVAYRHWDRVATEVPRKSSSQCRKRYGHLVELASRSTLNVGGRDDNHGGTPIPAAAGLSSTTAVSLDRVAAARTPRAATYITLDLVQKEALDRIADEYAAMMTRDGRVSRDYWTSRWETFPPAQDGSPLDLDGFKRRVQNKYRQHVSRLNKHK